VTPAAISYGTPLNATQLNATASVTGSFAYTPALGEMLSAGTHTLSVVFTPKDSADNTTAQATVSLTVTKATPIVTWRHRRLFPTAPLSAPLNSMPRH